MANGQTYYTVRKFSVLDTSAYQGSHEYAKQTGLTWDAATRLAIELGAKPGSGTVDGNWFATSELFVFISVETEKAAS